MTKKKKTRFFKGDRRPGSLEVSLKYTVEKIKSKWGVKEHPTNNIVATYKYKGKAIELADFHNHHRVWQKNGGIPKFLWSI